MKATLIAALAALGTLLAPAFAGEGWLTDYETARKQAAEEKKDILIDFTGSDWCEWCKRLKKEVFDKDAFKKAGPENFVLLELDFPEKDKPSEAIQKANEELRQKFGVEGFPTIILVDSEGRPYAQTGYQEGGAEVYVKHLKELRGVREARDEAFQTAADLKGLDRARALAKGLASMDERLILTFYAKEADEIIAEDKDNKTGLPEKLTALRDQQKRQSELESMLKEPANLEFQNKIEAALADLDKVSEDTRSAEARRRINDLIAKEKPVGVQLQMALYTRMSFFESMEETLPVFDEIIKADEKSPLGVKAREEKAQVVEMLKGVDESKGEGKDDEPEPATGGIIGEEIVPGKDAEEK